MRPIGSRRKGNRMRHSWKVVVTDAETTTLPIETREVEKIGGRLLVGACKTEDEVIELARDADAILYDYAPMTNRVISELGRCRVIVRYGVGLDRIDLEAAEAKGIEVRYLPGWSAEEVSDHAIAFILALARRLLPLDRWVRNGNWGYAGELHTVRVVGKRLGLIGFGAIARCVAVKAQGLGMHVMAHDPFVKHTVLAEAGVQAASLEDLLTSADFVSLHVPLNETTKGLLGPAEFVRMKQGAFLINTSRGGVADEPSLVAALQSGQLAGAGLDVFTDEPPRPGNPLFGIDSTILTPHMACYSEVSIDEMHQTAIGHVVDVLTKGSE